MEIIRKKHGRPRISKETEERVIELYNGDKMTCAEIAEVCGISKSSVFRIVSERRVGDGKEEADIK